MGFRSGKDLEDGSSAFEGRRDGVNIAGTIGRRKMKLNRKPDLLLFLSSSTGRLTSAGRRKGNGGNGFKRSLDLDSAIEKGKYMYWKALGLTNTHELWLPSQGGSLERAHCVAMRVLCCHVSDLYPRSSSPRKKLLRRGPLYRIARRWVTESSLKYRVGQATA
jgi:hypothetical protein